MKIWHQSLTSIEKVVPYRDAVKNHLRRVARPDVEIVLHGMFEDTYPSDPHEGTGNPRQVHPRRPGMPLHGSAGRAVPRHVAIIMDGNGRWAAKRGPPRGLPAIEPAQKPSAKPCERL